MTATTGQGHPRHQLRQFTVTVRRNTFPAQVVRVMAQTERNAVLRAGILLAAEGGARLAVEWIVTGVQDPAPFAWIPEEGNKT